MKGKIMPNEAQVRDAMPGAQASRAVVGREERRLAFRLTAFLRAMIVTDSLPSRFAEWVER